MRRKVSKDTIELNEVSTDMELQGNQLRVRLQNTPILEGISVNETQDEVIILLATIGSLHKLRFPHPRRLPVPSSDSSGRRTAQSIFHNFAIDSLRDPRNFHILSSVFPIYGSSASGPILSHSWLENGREAVFVLSNSSGSLLGVRMDGEKVQSFEFKSSNFMDKLKGFVPSIIRSSGEGEESVLCLSSHNFADDMIVIGLCRDLKIRFWSFSRQRCIHSISLQDMDSSALTVRRPAIRKLDAGDALVIVLYLNVNDRRCFSVYRVTQQCGSGGGIEAHHVSCLNTEHGEDLVDFQVRGEEVLYLTYNSRMQSCVKHASLKE